MISRIRTTIQKASGQAMYETIMVLVLFPVLLTMFNATLFFGKAMSVQVRVENFARYAAIKGARGEAVNLDRAIDANNRIVASYSTSNDSVPVIAGIVANSLIFLVGPYLGTIFGGGVPYSGIPHFGGLAGGILAPIGSDATRVRAFAQIPLDRSLPFLGGGRVAGSAGIDARTWRSDGTAGGRNPVGRWLGTIMRGAYLLQDGITRSSAGANFSVMDWSIISTMAPAPTSQFELIAFHLPGTITGIMEAINFIAP